MAPHSFDWPEQALRKSRKPSTRLAFSKKPGEAFLAPIPSAGQTLTHFTSLMSRPIRAPSLAVRAVRSTTSPQVRNLPKQTSPVSPGTSKTVTYASRHQPKGTPSGHKLHSWKCHAHPSLPAPNQRRPSEHRHNPVRVLSPGRYWNSGIGPRGRKSRRPWTKCPAGPS